MAEKEFREALEDLAAGGGVESGTGPGRGEGAEGSRHEGVAALRARFGEAIQQHVVMSGDEHVVYVAAERVLEVLRFLHDDPAQQYDFLADLTAVDWGGGRPLEVVYQLWSIPLRRALRVKAALPLNALVIDSVVGIWRTADWLEREVWDMFGIRFDGHPDLRRILMPDNYAEGHPLRKDFPLRGRFSRAEQTRRALAMDVSEHYTAEELAMFTEVERGSPPGEGR